MACEPKALRRAHGLPRAYSTLTVLRFRVFRYFILLVSLLFSAARHVLFFGGVLWRLIVDGQTMIMEDFFIADMFSSLRTETAVG